MIGFVVFMALTFAAAAAVFGIAFLASPETMTSNAVGCGISLLASWFGAVPLVVGKVSDAASQMKLGFMSMGMRLLMIVLLGVAAVLSGRFDHQPLLLSMAGSYLLLVAVDTAFTLRVFRNTVGTES